MKSVALCARISKGHHPQEPTYHPVRQLIFPIGTGESAKVVWRYRSPIICWCLGLQGSPRPHGNSKG